MVKSDNGIAQKLKAAGAIAVLTIDNVEDAVPVARALVDGGINAMELTLRTPAAIDSLKAIKKECPEMIAGAGTILTIEQVKQCVDAGADFGVAPGTNPKVIMKAQKLGLFFAPGIVTPTDIECAAVELGCRLLKFFPAESSGGLKYLKDISIPYNHLGISYLPLGGINTANAEFYLKDPLILAVGGSWIANKELIQKKDWETIKKNAAEARKLIDQTRG